MKKKREREAMIIKKKKVFLNRINFIRAYNEKATGMLQSSSSLTANSARFSNHNFSLIRGNLRASQKVTASNHRRQTDGGTSRTHWHLAASPFFVGGNNKRLRPDSGSHDFMQMRLRIIQLLPHFVHLF